MPEIKHKKKKRGMITPQGWWLSPTAGKVHFQSKYEKLFMEWLDQNNIKWQKNKDRFNYISPFDNKEHKYIPDFIVEDLKGTVYYVEVKGMVRATDPAKFEAFPENKKLILLCYEDLKQLGLDVKDPMEQIKDEPFDPTRWPFKILSQIPDWQVRGELTEDIKKKVSSKPFFEHFIKK